MSMTRRTGTSCVVSSASSLCQEAEEEDQTDDEEIAPWQFDLKARQAGKPLSEGDDFDEGEEEACKTRHGRNKP